jgi:pimeloyl-ACP methyl ester carboxylesterase
VPYAEVRDLRMYYEETGAGEPLVLLHGATGTLEMPSAGWGGLAPALAERQRAIQVEHRGHGRTDNPAGWLSYEQIAEDIAALIEHLGLAPAHVAGVSDGGIIALALGMARPELVRSLVLVGANYRNDASTRAANAILDAEVIEREHPDWAGTLADLHDAHHHPGYWRELMDQITANVAIAPDYAEADLARVLAPTLLVAGELDPWANLDQLLVMRRCIPNAELLLLNHAGADPMSNHIPQFTRPDLVLPAMLDFLGRHGG